MRHFIQILANRGNALLFQSLVTGLVMLVCYSFNRNYLMAVLAHRTEAVKFLTHRLTRIYPIYLIGASIDPCFKYCIHYKLVLDPPTPLTGYPLSCIRPQLSRI
jgi:hypothetical protein